MDLRISLIKIQAKYRFGENLIQNRKVNHIYDSGAVIIKIGPGYKIEPSLLIKTIGPAPTEIDLNARCFTGKMYG